MTKIMSTVTSPCSSARFPARSESDADLRARDAVLSVLALAPQQWDEQWVNRQQLLSRIAAHHPVLYSTGGWFLWDRASAVWRSATLFGEMRAAGNVWVDESPRFLMRWPRLPLYDRVAMRIQARRWTRWLRRKAGGVLIAQVCHPSYFPYVDLIRPDHLVYHVYDLYDHIPGWDGAWAAYERSLLERAELVFCVSQSIADELRAKVSREVRVLRNGADVAAFAQAAEREMSAPDDLAAIPRPRIGWTGSLHPQIDYRLVATLAERRPEWHFVFVGHRPKYTEPQTESDFALCERLPNAHFLGYKQRGEVPGYVANMDVNMMPYQVRLDRWIRFGHPLKLYEYLAAGRPVVSADLPAVREHADVIRFATGVDDWECAIAEALSGGGVGTPKARRTAAHGNSWDARAEVLRGWLEGLATGTQRMSPRAPYGGRDAT